MEREKPDFIKSGMPREDAEKFMALMLSAQKTRHKCVFVKYFRELGEKMMKEHAGDVLKSE